MNDRQEIRKITRQVEEDMACRIGSDREEVEHYLLVTD